VATCLVLLPPSFVAHSLQIAGICASFTPRWAAKSRRHLATFIYFHRLPPLASGWNDLHAGFSDNLSSCE
jgi:hypothetical protein